MLIKNSVMLAIYRALIMSLLVSSLLACSQGISSCLDDGISMEQVQNYIEQGKREELRNQLHLRAESGESAAQYFLGFIYWADKPQQSFTWFERSAENGCLEAALVVAQAYLDGESVAKDERQAFRWYLQAAEADDSSSIRMVARMYRLGQGVDVNTEKARYWSSKSW